MTDYPNRSHRQRKAETEKKEVKKVVNGTAKRRKNEARRLTDIFIQEDINSVKSYVFMDVLVPAIKNAIADIVTDGIDILLFGGTGRSKKGKSISGSYTNYVNYSSKDRHTSKPKDRERYSYDDIELDTRGEAEALLDTMDAWIEKYEEISVADYYEMVGLHGNFTDEKFGWDNLASASVERLRGGKYTVKLPRPKPLDY